MSIVNVNFNNIIGKIKPMHAVNNGPVKGGYEQVRSNFDDFKAAKIPYVRNHDASACFTYSAGHAVDVHWIFPNFDADVNDPASYDFYYTDLYTQTILETGAKVYYRLGSVIEHGMKKYGTIMPKDFQKWAEICEHIIRHYNEGWADGFYWNIDVWEIWNEPDGIAANGDRPNWTGNDEQFYELYKVASRHLKKCFPNLKIGGPSTSGCKPDWWKAFFEYQTADGEKSPCDFLGWHWYGNNPRDIYARAKAIRDVVDAAGYTDTETHLTEWNYLEGWTDKFVASIEAIIGIHGAAMTAAMMSVGQASALDMLMYYDARVSTCFNGMFDFYTLRPLKGYYPFKMFSALYELGNCAESSTEDFEGEKPQYRAVNDTGDLDIGTDDKNTFFATAAVNGDRHALMVTHYSYDKNERGKWVTLKMEGIRDGQVSYYLLDKDNSMYRRPLTVENGEAKVWMVEDSVILVVDYDIEN